MAATGKPADAMSSGPRFSIIWYGRDKVDHARTTLGTLRGQKEQSYELVVVDCGSTDGTVEAFLDAAREDGRIVFGSRSGSSGGDALLKALRLCRGEWIVVCPPDGTLRQGALELAAQWTARHPTAGALCAPGFLVDAFGGSSDRVDIVSLMLSSFRPFLPAALIRRSALLLSGLERDDWFRDAMPLDIFYRLAADHGLATIPDGFVDSSPALDAHGLPSDIESTIDDHLALASRAFSREGFFGAGQDHLLLECQTNQLSILLAQLQASGRANLAHGLMRRAERVLANFDALLKVDHRTLRSLQRLLAIRSGDLGLLAGPLQKLLTRSSQLSGRLPIHVGYQIWGAPALGPWMKRKAIYQTLPERDYHPQSPGRDALFADVYVLAGPRYEARGQIELAIETWDRARPPQDIDIDSLACQAMLKSAEATDATLAERQRAWTLKHIGERPQVTLPRPGKSDKIRVGYHCAFMDGDTMRNMMGNVIAAHDRTDFEVYGYAPRHIPRDIMRGFDVWRYTPAAPSQEALTDDDFVRVVRGDGIDVFVELTGFSPGHRFGAMSLRCAPVQVSFLNHTGTSQVPNVDYVLSDEICTPSGSEADRYYSETIYRLPGCFFCFDYTMQNEPDVTAAPVARNGFVTFGCFGTGSKIGTRLVELWAKILLQVPNSVLRIQNPQLSNAADRRYMADRFRQFGVPVDRLTLDGGVDRPTLLKAYARVDISLDTWPYSGGNTIAESLWHGVPVVTCRGSRFSSAYGASLVTAGGRPDLVAHSFDEYVRIAVDLASDRERLVRLRRQLRQRSLDYGLGDSWGFSRKLEDAYRDMLNRLDAGRYSGVATADGRVHVG